MINEKRVALQKSDGDRPRNSAQYPSHIKCNREQEIHVELRNRSNNNPLLYSWHTKLNDYIFRKRASRFAVHESMNTKVGNEVMKKNQSLIIHDARFTRKNCETNKTKEKIVIEMHCCPLLYCTIYIADLI